MRRATLIVLVVLVGGLALLLRQRARDLADPERQGFDHALLAGLAADDVMALRIDHLERASQVKLERDAQGTWYMTEPVAYPAEPSVLRQILTELERARGPLEPAPALAELGLAPPKIVLEAFVPEGGALRARRVELGANDVDPRLVLARVPGHAASAPGADGAVLRVSRALFSAVDHPADGFRLTRITPVRGDRVISLRRRGATAVEEHGVVDLDLDAVLESGGWRRVDPPRAALHPVAMGLLARAAAELRADRFVDDSPDDLAPYGLDPPAMHVEIEDDFGQRAVLHFGFAPEEADVPFVDRRWFAKRAEAPYVFGVSWQNARTLAQPANLLYDDQILRAFRTDVVRVELEAEGRRVVVERAEERWSVAEGETRFPADPGRVEDLLAALEQTRIGDAPPDVAFAPEDPPRRITVTTTGDVRWGGDFGGPARNPADGAAGVAFRRFGDDLVGLVADDVARLTSLRPEDLRTWDLHKLVERDVARIAVSRGEQSLSYAHREDDWFAEDDSAAVAPLVGALFDHLLHPVAVEWLAPEGAEMLADACEIRLTTTAGADVELTIGRAADGAVEARTPDGRRALLREGDAILADLLRLFAG